MAAPKEILDLLERFDRNREAYRSAKLPLSILTDFEEFAVYDCRIKPDKSDKASTARILYLNDRDYLARWEEIAATDRQIDRLVYELYELTDEEIRIVEGTVG